MGKRKQMIKRDRETAELGLEVDGRTCTKCGKRKVYQNIESMDWCEPCIWAHVKDSTGQGVDK